MTRTGLSLFIASVALATSASAQTASPDAAVATVPAPAKPAKAKLICRSSTVTGSLVQQARRCGTAEDWARSNDAERNYARNMVSTHASGMTTN